MNFRRIFQETDTVTSSDGRTIPCNYLAHPRFSHDCTFCSSLHYAFVQYCPDRSYSKGYDLRKAINVLLDFTVGYESSNPAPLHLSTLERLTAEAFYGFHEYAQRTKAPQGIASRLGSALNAVAQSHDDGMPVIAVPQFGYDKGKPYEPLTEDCFKQLTQALRSHIDILYAKLEFRKTVDQAAPYNATDLSGLDRFQISQWEPDAAKCIKTLICRGHPFHVEHQEYTAVIRSAIDRSVNAAGDCPAECVYRRYINQKVRRCTIKPLWLDELFELYYPTAMDQAAIAVFIALQSGWNKETVMAIDGDNFQHVLAGALNDTKTLVFSEKSKSQGNDKPFKDPKTFLFPSSKRDKYSVYNLICLAKLLAEPISKLPQDHLGSEHQVLNPLFACIRTFKQMYVTIPARAGRATSRPGRYSSVSSKLTWTTGLKSFFATYTVFENGKRLTSPVDIGNRLRPSWVQFVRDKRNSPLSLIALQQGHESIETTDIHYDSSGPALNKRRRRLRSQLDALMQQLRKKQFKGLIGRSNDPAIDIASMRIFTLPKHHRSLWACTDSYKPDWPGSAAQHTNGKQCTEIAKCLFCSRICVFEDSLPFLMERQAYLQLDLERSGGDLSEFIHSEELGIIEYIFEVWGDEVALKKAARYRRKHMDLLPPDMSVLSVVFEEDP